MDRLHELEVLVAVADAGSLSRAASRLRLSPPAVTRAVASLEDRLGARLFNRTTRSLTTTEAGERFLASARRILSDLETAQREAAGEAAVPHGHLTLTASVSFGRSVLAPVVWGFLGRNPRVTASMLLLDRVANLVEEGIDLAVRIGPLPDSGLIARRVGAVRRLLVASPGYLEQNGQPLVPTDLKEHRFIGFTGLMPLREWRYHDGARQVSFPLAPAFEVNDALTAIEAAQQGHGITPALSYMVQDQIRDRRLVEVLADDRQPELPVNLVYPHSRLVAPKVRAFVDFAAPLLGAELDRLATSRASPP